MAAVALRAAALLTAAGCALFVAWHTRADGDAAEPAPRPAEAGPIRQAIPADARVAKDEGELARLLAEPSGPEEVWLLPRVYRGDFSVKRKLRLRGAAGAELVGTGQGTVLSLEAEGIEVDNLVVRHSGRHHTREDAAIKATAPKIAIRRVRVEDFLFGISLAPCPGCLLERAYVRGVAGDLELQGDSIKLWEASDSVVRDCVVEGGRDVVVWYSRRVLFDGNTVSSGRYGTHFMYAHDSVVRRSRITNNVVGVFVMYSSRLRVEDNVLAGARGPAGMGIGFKESDGVSLAGNWLVANTVGAYLDRTPRAPNMPVTLSKNVLALNGVGLRFHSSGEGVSFLANDFRRNRVEVEVEGGGDVLKVRFAGNYWSDYVGYDLDRNGTGDVAYSVKRLSSGIVGIHPAVRLFDGTLAMSLVDLVARAVPVFATDLILNDPTPSMNRNGGERDPS